MGSHRSGELPGCRNLREARRRGCQLCSSCWTGCCGLRDRGLLEVCELLLLLHGLLLHLLLHDGVLLLQLGERCVRVGLRPCRR